MKRQSYVLEGLVILMFCISVAGAVGFAIKAGAFTADPVFWWIAAGINAHSFISLAKTQ